MKLRAEVDLNAVIALDEVLRIDPKEDISEGGAKLTPYAKKILQARRLLGLDPVTKYETRSANVAMDDRRPGAR